MEISKKDMKVLLKSQQGELDAVLMYNALAQVAKHQKDKDGNIVKECSLKVKQSSDRGKTVVSMPPTILWGYSSVGRAPALQAGGQGFESL